MEFPDIKFDGENMEKRNFQALIAGRENVGKSSIFNKLIKQPRAIVEDYPGVTRDRIYGTVEWTGRSFTVVDTGGLLLDGEDRIKKEVTKQVKEAMKESDIILFTVDCQAGLIPEDKKIFEWVKRSGRPYIILANKADEPEKFHEAGEFYALGAEHIFPVSAAHSYGLDDVLDHIIAVMPPAHAFTEAEKATRVSIVGKENVGKSSIFNALINEERSIVTEIPGTTRDSVDTMLEIDGKKLLLVDTAGVKKRKRIKEKAEEYSIGRSFANVKRSDIAVHVIDALEGIHDMDKNLIGYTAGHFKGMVLVINKWDLVDFREKERKKKEYTEFVRDVLGFVYYVPVVFTSAKTGAGLKQLLEIVFQVETQYNLRVKTSVLNRVFQETIYDKSPSSGTGMLKLYYMSQVSSAPPTFLIFVNKKDKIKGNYMKYIEKSLRKEFGFDGVPIRFKIREKKKKEDIIK